MATFSVILNDEQKRRLNIKRSRSGAKSLGEAIRECIDEATYDIRLAEMRNHTHTSVGLRLTIQGMKIDEIWELFSAEQKRQAIAKAAFTKI